MKNQIISFLAVTLMFIFIFSCSKKEDPVKAAEPLKTEPVKIVIDTMKVDSLIADTCVVDTFLLDESMIDSFSVDTSKVLSGDKTEDSFRTDLEILGLKGRVKSVTENSYKALDKFGEIEKGLRTGKSSSMIFEPSGMISEEQYFSSDGKALSSKKNMYDNKGNKIENNFDQNGKLENTKKISYDIKGSVTEESVYNSQGILESKYRYKYIGLKMTEACEYNSEGRPSRVELYAYDENGNKTEENFYNSDGELTDTHRFMYEKDAAGNITVKDFFKTEDAENISWEKFDPAGNKIEEGEGKNGGSDFIITGFKYDVSGNLIEESCNNPEQIIKYSYEYDKTGNWTKRISYEKKVGIPQVLTERTILYYE